MVMYREKSTIEAQQLPHCYFGSERIYDEIAAWCGGRLRISTPDKYFEALMVPTAHGDQFANAGDYVIKGTSGQFSACNGHYFDTTYERVKGN